MAVAKNGSTMDLTVEHIERIPVGVPFRSVPGRNLKAQANWRDFLVLEVELAGGHLGYGEAMLDYWSGDLAMEDVQSVIGRNAAEQMWDDSLGWAIQTALFDAVGRALGVPIHELLGEQVHDRTPLAWWCIDMPPGDFVHEAQCALEHGYTDMKVKGRPWFDIREQLERLTNEVPESFTIDVDFNDTLLDANRAITLLQEFDEYQQVEIYETPIPQDDVDGNRRIREETDGQIAMHYGTPDPKTAICKEVCDGFVVTGPPGRLMEIGSVAAMADRPFFLQLVGTGITAAHSLHFGGVLEQARWPAINCHQIYENSLLVDPIDVDDGFATVPSSPGLGHRVDREALERYRVDEVELLSAPARLVEVSWIDGETLYCSSLRDDLMEMARAGELPYFEQGVTTRVIEHTGSDRAAELLDRVAEGPVFDDE